MLLSRRVFSGVSCSSVSKAQPGRVYTQVQRRSTSVAVRASAEETSQAASEDRWDTVSADVWNTCCCCVACVVAWWWCQRAWLQQPKRRP